MQKMLIGSQCWLQSVAKVSVRGTDPLGHTDEHKNTVVRRKKAHERFVRWNNIVRNLETRNAGRMILMDFQHEPCLPGATG